MIPWPPPRASLAERPRFSVRHFVRRRAATGRDPLAAACLLVRNVDRWRNLGMPKCRFRVHRVHPQTRLFLLVTGERSESDPPAASASYGCMGVLRTHVQGPYEDPCCCWCAQSWGCACRPHCAP